MKTKILEDLVRRRGAEAWHDQTAGNIIAFLIACVFAGPLTATADVEIKFVVKTDQVEKAIGALGLDKAAAEKRTIYFFDTKDLSLLNQSNASIILRSRTTEGKDKGDTTVKLRARGTLEIED